MLGRSIQVDTRRDVSKRCIKSFVDRVNGIEAPAILELGSREISQKGLFRDSSRYVGFDIHAGRHVDVVGDAHRLSEYFPPESFDAVYSISVFEHLAMPWKVVLEINRVLKPGGLLFIVTHPAYPPHCQPWDFWRFSRSAFSVLLNERTGYEIIDWAEGLPSIQVPIASMEPPLRGIHKAQSFMSIAVLARKTGASHASLSWDVEMESVMHDKYPTGKAFDTTLDFVDLAKGRGTALGDLI